MLRRNQLIVFISVFLFVVAGSLIAGTPNDRGNANAAFHSAPVVYPGPTALPKGGPTCGDPLDPNCIGTCGALFDGGQQQVGAGTCSKKAKGGCECVFKRAEGTCKLEAKGCKGDCEPLYRSAADSRAQKNPIKGKCELTNAIQVTCECVYRYR